jgi:putative membrane protein
MSILAMIFVALIAVLHFYIAWFEMFAWETRGPKVFTTFPADLFAPTKAMAANQGLYNGFIAAGLLWSLFIGDDGWQRAIAVFFLLCVAIAGAYGAATVSPRILYVQTVPAVIALLLIWIF